MSPLTADMPVAMPETRAGALALDSADPLAGLRELFDLPADVIYLDGNSLGALPRTTAHRMQQVVQEEWGKGLIRSWNEAAWVALSQHIAAKIAPLIGATERSVSVGDSTSVNLFKVLHAAVTLAGAPAAGRHVILSERSNFPTDLYIAESVAHATGLTLRTGDANELEQHFDDRLAVLLLTHVNYRDGRMHDMARVTRTAHEAGALVVWDLAHSAGAVPVDLMGADADFAVGCGYKYLNGGPGAPAFLWAHPRHTERMDRQLGRQPLTGWFGHAEPFRFETGYRAAAGIAQFACGTPPILSLAALDCGVSLFGHVEPVGGMPALRRKSVALTNHFMAGIDRFGAGLGLSVVTPREANDRGSQVSVGHPHAQQVMQSLIERGVVGDYRAGAALGESGVMRFGFTPLYTRFVDVWDALDHLREVLHGEVWTAPRFQRSAAVT